jgi:Family of unknown function (DUF6152)
MKSATIALVMSVSLGLTLARPSFGHHSEANFNMGSEMHLMGIVSAIEFENPHVHISLAASTSQGQVEVWQIETASPNMLIREGWKRSSLKPGDRLAISGHPARDGSRTVLLETATLPNGQRFDPRAFLRE